jgi:hypothetical protein
LSTNDPALTVEIGAANDKIRSAMAAIAKPLRRRFAPIEQESLHAVLD